MENSASSAGPSVPPPGLAPGAAGVVRTARAGEGVAICDLFASIEWDEDAATKALRQSQRAAFIDGGAPAPVVAGREHFLPRYHVFDVKDRGVLAAVETAPPVEWITQRPTLSPEGMEALAAAVVEVHAIAVEESQRGHGMGRLLLDRALGSAADRGFRLAMAIMHAEEVNFYTATGWHVVDNKTLVGVTAGPGAEGIAWRPLDPNDPRLRLAFKALHPQVSTRRGLVAPSHPQQAVVLDGVIPARQKHVVAAGMPRFTDVIVADHAVGDSPAGGNRAERRAAARGRRRR